MSVRHILFLAGCLWAATATAADSATEQDFRSLDLQAQQLKQQVLDINRDLGVLEQELLFPADSQLTVFLSMNVGAFFDLDSVELKLDGKDVTQYLYSDNEVEALHKGGIQRLYVGHITTGSHELLAVYKGVGPHERDYRRATSIKFEKGVPAKLLELKIRDVQNRQQPEFQGRVWE